MYFQAPSAAYTTQHLSLTLTVRIVPSLAAAMSGAIAHINEHGSHESHPTNCIVTESTVASTTFVRGEDSVGVFVNASTPACTPWTFSVTVSAWDQHWTDPHLGACWTQGTRDVQVCRNVLRSWGEGGHIIGEFSQVLGKRQYTHQLIEVKKLPF
jgi:glutamate-5-semialdehyde dehydrogenase